MFDSLTRLCLRRYKAALARYNASSDRFDSDYRHREGSSSQPNPPATTLPQMLEHHHVRIKHALRHLELAGERLDKLVDDEVYEQEIREVLEKITDAYFELQRLQNNTKS